MTTILLYLLMQLSLNGYTDGSYNYRTDLNPTNRYIQDDGREDWDDLMINTI